MSWPHRLGRARRRSERGFILVTVAFLLIAMIGVAAIVIDLGQGYAVSRRMQNAADAAALAAGRTLDQVKNAGASPATVDATARASAAANGADASAVVCTVIDWQGNPLGSCGTSTVVTDTRADGVQVTAGTSFPALFAAIGPATVTLTVNRSSAATIQPLLGQDAPLLACAFGQTDGTSASPDLLVGTPGSWRINHAAVGKRYLLHGPQVAVCNLGSPSWKGDAGPGPFNLPGWLGLSTGDKAGPIRSAIAGQTVCGSAMFVGCALVLPICDRSDGGTGINGNLYCDVFGAFRLVAQTSNSQIFEFLGRVTVTTGQGGDGTPGPDDVRVVKLIK